MSERTAFTVCNDSNRCPNDVETTKDAAAAASVHAPAHADIMRDSTDINRRTLRLATALLLAFAAGCQAARESRRAPPNQTTAAVAPAPANAQARSPVRLVAHQGELAPRRDFKNAVQIETLPPPVAAPAQVTLEDLEAQAIAANPTLRRMQQEAAAERAKAGYAFSLPDPTVSSMFFGDAMNFVPDKQIAEVQVMQEIPWLGRLRSEARQAQLEAMAAQNAYLAERLRVIGDLRAAWYRLYVLGKQLQTTDAEQAQIDSLIRTANARIATGDAQSGDVLMATLELSNLQEQRLVFRQLVVAATTELNRLAGREPSAPLAVPAAIDVRFPQWNYELLRQAARTAQPELNAARLRTAAARWGIEVARLKRRPELAFGASWMVMTADPGDPMPGAGDDAWTLNVAASVPLWRRKYDAITSEAARRHSAAFATEEDIGLQLDARLNELWAQAVSNQQTVLLYQQTILPQARQTFEADLQSLSNNAVTFDRVIRDYRTLLNLQFGTYRAQGELATTIARLRQAVGVDLSAAPVNENGPAAPGSRPDR